MKTVLKALYDRNKVIFCVGAALCIFALHLLLEFVAYQAGLDVNEPLPCLLNVASRCFIGFIATFVLYSICEDDFKSLYTGKIPRAVVLLLIPVLVYFLSYFDVLSRMESITFAYTVNFLASSLQQIATGFFEETISRGIVMYPYRKRFSERKWRFAAVFMSGLIFGFAHLAGDLLFGASLGDSIYHAFMTMAWGMFVAVIYMLSDNLLLVMIIHAVWDIVIRISGYFINQTPGSTAITVIGENLRFVIHPCLFIVLAVLVCWRDDFWQEKMAAEE